MICRMAEAAMRSTTLLMDHTGQGAGSGERSNVLRELAKSMSHLIGRDRCAVAVDGVDGAGKTTFANALVPYIQAGGRTVIRASVDGFHNPRAVRYRRGRFDAQGFFEDSYDYASLRRYLLDPFLAGAASLHTTRFDHVTDRTVDCTQSCHGKQCVLLFDGIFLHRRELREFWTCSIFLDVPFDTTFARMASRDGTPADPAADRNRRYLMGQRLYLAQCCPAELATFVVDNCDFYRPKITHKRAGQAQCGQPSV
jgi:uridine kinase